MKKKTRFFRTPLRSFKGCTSSHVEFPHPVHSRPWIVISLTTRQVPVHMATPSSCSCSSKSNSFDTPDIFDKKTWWLIRINENTKKNRHCLKVFNKQSLKWCVAWIWQSHCETWQPKQLHTTDFSLGKEINKKLNSENAMQQVNQLPNPTMQKSRDAHLV